MQNKKVIVADTGTEARRQLVNAINSAQDLTVVGETNDGEELLSVCCQTQCDIIVMDLILSTIDGLDVLDRLSTLPARPTIIVLSSFAIDRVAKLSIDRGADYLMLKPCKVDSVVKRIRQMTQPAGTEHPTPQPASDSEAAVTALLHEIGIPAHIKGYQYLREAILTAVEDMNVIDGITKILYPRIAKQHGTTTCGVERAIRHAIGVAWERGDPDVLRHYFGYSSPNSKRKPTNSDFIALIADQLQLHTRSNRSA